MTSLHTTDIFHNGWANLHSHQHHKSSLFSISSPAFVIFDIFDNSHPDRHDVITCSFDLHFPDDYQCWASVHVPVGQLSILFGKIFIQVFFPVFNQDIVVWLFQLELYELYIYIYIFVLYTVNFITAVLSLLGTRDWWLV